LIRTGELGDWDTSKVAAGAGGVNTKGLAGSDPSVLSFNYRVLLDYVIIMYFVLCTPEVVSPISKRK
jgi:hypothetical protein